MGRLVALLAVSALSGAALSAPVAWAAEASPDKIQFAATEHDLGYRAYVAKRFDEAASHFENAFFAAPNAAELRGAIRARREAGQDARAATLAAIGQREFAGDVALDKLASETIAAARPKVFELRVTSPEECSIAADSRVVTTEKARDARFFLDPGKHEVIVGWSDERSTTVQIDAKAGASQTLELTPPPPSPRVSQTPGGSTPPAVHSKPWGPGVFLAGAGLTLAGVGVTVWSGLDAVSHPGTAAVKSDCVGQGTSCPQYQEGLDAQRRTNILIAATSGVGVVTLVIGAFLTQWSQPESAPPSSGRLHLEPVVGLDHAGLRGTF